MRRRCRAPRSALDQHVLELLQRRVVELALGEDRGDAFGQRARGAREAGLQPLEPGRLLGAGSAGRRRRRSRRPVGRRRPAPREDAAERGRSGGHVCGGDAAGSASGPRRCGERAAARAFGRGWAAAGRRRAGRGGRGCGRGSGRLAGQRRAAGGGASGGARGAAPGRGCRLFRRRRGGVRTSRAPASGRPVSMALIVRSAMLRPPPPAAPRARAPVTRAATIVAAACRRRSRSG